MKVIESPMQFTVSARGKPAAVPIQKFIQNNYAHIPLEQIDSFFGFTEVSTLVWRVHFLQHRAKPLRCPFALRNENQRTLTTHQR
jgi:hypothetical protein